MPIKSFHPFLRTNSVSTDRNPVSARHTTLQTALKQWNPATQTSKFLQAKSDQSGYVRSLLITKINSCFPNTFHMSCPLQCPAGPADDTATNTDWQLPEVVLIQFASPDDEHDVLITCRELQIKNKYTERNLCVASVIYQESLFIALKDCQKATWRKVSLSLQRLVCLQQCSPLFIHAEG